MFKHENIYFLDEEDKIKVVGCEILAKTDIPNSVLFAETNLELEYYLYKKIISKYNSMFNSNNGLFWTINLSPSTLIRYQNDKTLDNFDIEELPKNVFIELTEQGTYSKSDIEQIRTYSHRIILDDFGTGLSNIDKAISLRPYGIKIDTSILNCSFSYIKSLVEELKSCTSVLIGEKVENIEQYDAMRALSIDYFQGFFITNKFVGKYHKKEQMSSIY